MDLTSCTHCGVVLDKDNIVFPSAYDHDTQELITENVEWDGKDYVAVIPCPICDNNIRE